MLRSIVGTSIERAHKVAICGLAAVVVCAGGNASADPTLYGFGGAPNSYGTLLSSNGARTLDGSNLYLGATGPAMRANATPALNYGDPIPYPVFSTSDGVKFLGSYTTSGGTTMCDPDPFFYQSGCYGKVEITVTALNHANWGLGTVYLDGWLDWAHDGTFDSNAGSNEHIVSASLDPTTWSSDTFTDTFWFYDAPGPDGPFYARFRVSDQANSPTGQTAIGEVEDYGGLGHGQGVPEIDANAGTSALALLLGCVALMGERRRRFGPAATA